MNSEFTFVYPKDKDGKRSGYTIAVLVKNKKIFTGVALCSTNDHFCKKTGQTIATERAGQAYERWKAVCKERKLSTRVLNKLKKVTKKSKVK